MKTSFDLLAFFRRAAANAVVVGMLLLIIAQVAPWPDWMNFQAIRYADKLGLSQGNWGMFTPEPDHENHRVEVVVAYSDGSQRTWRSPEWRERSLWRRFVTARELEYIDEIHNASEEALADFSQWLLRNDLRSDAEGIHARRIEVWEILEEIPDPRRHGWRPRTREFAGEKRTLIYDKDDP